jgi:hypothetical protein
MRSRANICESKRQPQARPECWLPRYDWTIEPAGMRRGQGKHREAAAGTDILARLAPWLCLIAASVVFCLISATAWSQTGGSLSAGEVKLAGVIRTALPVPPARRISHHPSVEFPHIKASNHGLVSSGKGKPFAAVLNTVFAGAPVSGALHGLERQAWPPFFVVRAFDARGPPAPLM